MSVTSVDNQDLQTYLDSFNKEIEEGNGSLITLPPEAVEALAGADEIAHKILHDEDEEDDHTMESEENGTYFVDQDGNYYFQANKDSVTSTTSTVIEAPAKVSTKSKAAPKTGSIVKKTVKSMSLKAKTDTTEDMNYVLIVDKSTKMQARKIVKTDDPDDPEKEIYEFDETEVAEGDADDKDLFIPGKVIRLKPNNSGAAADGVVHRCVHCKYETNKRFLLSRHMKAHSDDRPFKCSVCERGFKSNASLLNHVNTHIGNKPHACKSCEMCFTTSGELVRHMRYRHTHEKPHKCTECDYCSVELSKLRRHMRCHTGERPYQCPHCTYASPDTFKLKRHMRTHTGEKPYECDICHARFTQSNSLKAHRLIHSVGDKPIFQCALCPTTCGRKTDLRLHVQKLHHSENPIKCRRCNKELPDRYSYKVHIKTHEGEKCYRCQMCPYASISQRHLESHMLVHTDQKPFVCEFCDLSFRQRQLLKRHINLYHNKDYVPPTPREKMHLCPHCPRSFTHKGNLIRHMEMHDPESKAQRDKVNLKMGRLTKVKSHPPMATVTTNNYTFEEFDGDESEFTSEEDYEIIETIDDEEVDEKPVIAPILKCDVRKIEESAEFGTQFKTGPIKKEPDTKEILAVEVEDGQQYMVVEVYDDDDEDDDDDENCITVTNTATNGTVDGQTTQRNDFKIDLNNCFGFEQEDNDEYTDNLDSKETIQLLQIIEDE